MSKTTENTLALDLIGQSLERSPHAAMLMDSTWRVLVANREARRLYGVLPQMHLPGVTTSDGRVVTRGLAHALCSARAVPMKLAFGGATEAFQAWRVDPLPGEKHGMVMLKADPSTGVTARLSSLAAAHAEAEERLAAAEAERARLRRTAEHLDAVAKTDMMTGLLNAHAFRLRCASLLARGASSGALLFVDLNGFKPVNDRFGHAAGDHVLRTIALLLRGAVRESDLVGRLGGDEFVLWLRDVTAEDLPSRLTALRETLSQPITWERQPGVTIMLPHDGAAIGAALTPDDGYRYEDLLAIADHRMYADKPAAHQPGTGRRSMA